MQDAAATIVSIKSKHDERSALMAEHCDFGKFAKWKDSWYSKTFVKMLYKNDEDVLEKGIHVSESQKK